MHKGYCIKLIAEKLNRLPLEVALLVMDRAEVGELKPRKTGIYGIEEAIDEKI
ncbi:hypothetical protein [Psychrobacillus sp. FSL K6-1267]|uniref:hypothetical protein n=1 Tax=Psychrobacillus sp. FSL K6-1267 TaxID=2921543 RepID=UPI0030F5DB0C